MSIQVQGVKSITIILIVVGFWIFIGIGWHNNTVYGDFAACFNSERDYKEFLIDNNNREYLVTFPCPTNENDNLLNNILPKNESGK